MCEAVLGFATCVYVDCKLYIPLERCKKIFQKKKIHKHNLNKIGLK